MKNLSQKFYFEYSKNSINTTTHLIFFQQSFVRTIRKRVRIIHKLKQQVKPYTSYDLNLIHR